MDEKIKKQFNQIYKPLFLQAYTRGRLEAEKPKWIKLQDELPPKNSLVILYGGNHYYFLEYIYNPKHYLTRHIDFPLHRYKPLTHWIIAPPPPENFK